MFKHLIAAAVVLGLGSTAFAGKYVLDTAHGEVGFKIKHLGISTVRGKFNDFNGTFEWDEATGKLENLKATIKTASIDTNNDKRDDHLRSPDFFNAKKNPTITFTGKKVESANNKPTKIIGDLTMNGITKEVALDVKYEGATKNPWGQDVVGFEATGKVNRKDFGLTWNKTLETGGLLVGEEVTIEIAGEANPEAKPAPPAKKK
ncbi:MAG TPA: YceI family protein [Bdellovibrionales bacterium]|nr:YceI family protein [Bdellovibrionales bacterium]